MKIKDILKLPNIEIGDEILKQSACIKNNQRRSETIQT